MSQPTPEPEEPGAATAEAALEAERVAHARAMVRVAHAEAMWANTEAALEASERENERLREALEKLEHQVAFLKASLAEYDRVVDEMFMDTDGDSGVEE